MELDISFQTEDAMNAMMNFIEKKREELIKQGGELPIPCKVETHECMHDVGGPCSGYKVVEFDGVTDHGTPAEDAVPEEVKTVIKAPLEAEKEVLVAEKVVLQAEIVELKKPKEVEHIGPTGE